MLLSSTLDFLKEEYKLAGKTLELAIGCVENLRDSIKEAVREEFGKDADELAAYDCMLGAIADNNNRNKNKDEKVIYEAVIYPAVAIELGLYDYR